ncbi:MAG: trypsin-like serine protease [Litorimonas sp.]
MRNKLLRPLAAVIGAASLLSHGYAIAQDKDSDIRINNPPQVAIDHVTIPNYPVYEGDFPSTVRITKHYTDRVRGSKLASTCTGTVITNLHVMTAAHCEGVDETKYVLDGYMVHYGSVNVDAQSFMRVHSTMVPSSYRGQGDQANDIAVYELTEALNSASVIPVTLASQSTLRNAQNNRSVESILTGYGYFSLLSNAVESDPVCGNIQQREVHSSPSRLNAATLQLANAGLSTNPIVTTNPRCQAPVGGCFGDSGGPLYAKGMYRPGDRRDLIQTGVVSGASYRTAAEEMNPSALRWDTSQDIICFLDTAETAYSNVASQRSFIEEAVALSPNPAVTDLCFDNGAGGCE